MNVKGITSPNFEFLKEHDALLVQFAMQAERYCVTDPNTCLIKLRQFAELLAGQAAAYTQTYLYQGDETTFNDILRQLKRNDVITGEIADLFYLIKDVGNKAVHDGYNDARASLYHLRMAHKLAVWFYRSFGKNRTFKAGAFVPPPNPKEQSAALEAELSALKARLAEAVRVGAEAQNQILKESQAREKAEQDAQKAYEDLDAALELAGETEEELAEERARFARQLADTQTRQVDAPLEKATEYVTRAKQAAADLDLDESDTRKLIDRQLRHCGWEVNTESISYKKGVRPAKGRNMAIAEWPTSSGPADYVLFVGLMPVGVVEAKRRNIDALGAIDQAKRYSRDFILDDKLISPGGPWDKYQVPFLYSSNGREYLKQIDTKTGVWFLDARKSTNHPAVRSGWPSPERMKKLLKQDVDAANSRLKDEPADYLPLRDYQLQAVQAAEKAIAEGQKEILLAMATGTGKTRTCIGLVYRLVKSGRFERVLFLVDRTALGEQAQDAFGSLRIENQQTFETIYDIKKIDDFAPESDTRLQIATVQGMMHRLYGGDDGLPQLSVDQYDCIVVDECHRGYNLDKEMSDTELDFRSEADYVSKYRRVIEYFDAIKVGLTATPALHTKEIFGNPVHVYSYRQAVIDGYLVDHEPPIRIVTKLAEEGMVWKAGEEMTVYKPTTDQLDLFNVQDEIAIEIEHFNKEVETEAFNRVVCEELARQIDPNMPGKTMVFCATDSHADMVVRLLKDAFDAQYGAVDDDTVKKITGRSDKPLALIRNYKNERLPVVAVTVDLLTTGIDVPEIVNLVFLRRVRSRILYEQMLGRATRLCEDLYGKGEDKEVFRIFDAVDLYSALLPWSSMKPVVTNPKVTFESLVADLNRAKEPEAVGVIKDQLLAKLRRTKKALKGDNLEKFKGGAGGITPDDLIRKIQTTSGDDLKDWFTGFPQVASILDNLKSGPARGVIISNHDDELVGVERGYGKGEKPEDYLESFGRYIEENKNRIPALMIVLKRPKELTRQQLRELKLTLDSEGYTEASLRTAWRETTNEEIAASIIGFIRQQALGAPLKSYEERVNDAIKKMLAQYPWTTVQRNWLKRIGKQLINETVVDKAAFDRGQFKHQGGFNHLNKTFSGRLETVMNEIGDLIWDDAG